MTARPHQIETDRLLAAAEDNDVPRAVQAIAAGARVNAFGKDGATALVWAARHGNTAFAQTLVDAGAESECPDNFGFTPLLAALAASRNDCARGLLTMGFNATARAAQGDGALHLAGVTGDAGLIQALAVAGADLDARDAHGATPLMAAVRHDNAEAVHALLALGADVNARDRDGRTPLVHAITNTRADIVCILLDQGANPALTDARGRDALDIAQAWHSGDMRRRLEEAYTAATATQLTEGARKPVDVIAPLRFKPRPPGS